MADVDKRRSVFISNIPPSSSATALETFLLQKLKSSTMDRSHLQVIFPVSTSSPQLALATFQDEKAMVTLMRKRLLFEGEHLTMQPFSSQVFSSMTAVINPDITELFPFNSLDFSRLLEKQSGVECRKMDERDRDRGTHASQSSSSQEFYVLTGNWFQLQNARKFMQEWLVNDTNRRDRSWLTNSGPGTQDKRTLEGSSSSLENTLYGNQANAHGIEQTRGLNNGTGDHDGVRHPEDIAAIPIVESHSAVTEASDFITRAEERGLVNEDIRTDSRRESKDGAATPKPQVNSIKVSCSFEGPSLKPGDSSLERHLQVEGDGGGIEMVHHHRPNYASSNSSKDGEIPKERTASQGLLQHGEPPKSLHLMTSKKTQDFRNQDNSTIPLSSYQGVLNEATMYDGGDVREHSSSVEDWRKADNNCGREMPPSRTTGAEPFSSVSTVRSEDELSVGSSLNYMKHVKVPQTPLAKVPQAPFDLDVHRPEQSADHSQRIGRTYDDRDNGATLSRRDHLETDSAEPLPSSSTLDTDGGRVVGDDYEQPVEGLGSLPVDPGVFSYILLKRSNSIQEIEEKFGVKFSMHLTRDNYNTDVESALLKITPTVEAAEIAQAHDAFVDYYSYVFSNLEHRVISTADTALDPESLNKTVELIHERYKTVLLTVSHKKVLIYGPIESDVRFAKCLIIEALKEKPTPLDRSEIHSPIGDHSAAIGRVDSPSLQLDPEMGSNQDITEVDGQAEHSFTRGGIDGSSGEHETDNIPQVQTHLSPEHDDPQPFSVDELGLLSSVDLEVDSSPPTQVDRHELDHSSANERLNGPSPRFEDEAADYEQAEGPRRINNPASSPSFDSSAGPVALPSVAMPSGVTDGEVTEPDGQNPSDGAGIMADIIPVDPGVFAFIQTQKHNILCDMEHNYGIKFSVKGNLESDVYMVEVVPRGAASERVIQRGKEAFVTFYSEVFGGLEHRAISLGDFENVSQDELGEIIQEMEHSFSDILFRVVSTRILIYGQGRHNVETAKDLVIGRLRGSLASSRVNSVLQHDDDMSIASMGNDTMISRLNHLRYGSLSPEALRALPQSADIVARESVGERIDPNTNDDGSSDEADIGHQSPQRPFPSPVGERTRNGRNEQLDSSQSSGNPSDAILFDQSGNLLGARDDRVPSGNAGDVTYRFQDDCLILDFSSGICILVYCRDITKMHVDAIVNAANERLSNMGGVAGAIRRAAGEIMQADCNRYIARRGLLYPAKVVHTGPGNLPCKFVLHAVGPQWWDYLNKQQCRETLRATIMKCLRIANERLQVTSLAMPFISSGIFGVPLEICIEEICKALLDVNKQRLASPHGILHQVHIVDINSENIRHAQDIMVATLCPKPGGAEITLGVNEADGGENFAENGASRDGGYENLEREDHHFVDDASLMSEDAVSRRSSHLQRGASAKSSRSQRRQSSSSDEDVPHENLGYKRKDDLISSRPAMVRSTSLPYLSRDDSEDAGRTPWAYKTSTLPSRDSTEFEYLSTGKRSSRAWERGREPKRGGEHVSRTTSKVSTKETSQEEKVRELIDAYSRAAPSPELSRKTEYEINRILTEQERGAKDKRQRPKRRTQSLDRRPRDKCFVCSSPVNLSKRKSCEHFVCEMCKRLDVGRCKECSKTKKKKEPEKKCDLCFCSTKHLLMDCSDCENSVCINCIKKGMDRCLGCIHRMHSSDRHTEKKQPKLREPIIGTRSSRIDTKKGYRIKAGGSDSAGTRRKPMLGLNQPLDVVARSHSSSVGIHGSMVSTSSHKHSAFSKEFVTEEAPHEEVLRRLTREQAVRPHIPNDAVKNHTSAVSDLQMKHTHSRKQAGRTEELKVVGRASAPVSRQQPTTCVICMDTIKDPKALSKCKHTFCSACIEKAMEFKPVCPICGMRYGKLRGNQPDGNMNYTTVLSDLPGHPGCGTIIITYRFPGGIQSSEHPNPGVLYHGTHRDAYLPNSREGHEVLKLLVTAFEARLLFTIGRSVTTGEDNVVVWNDVHHKTRQTGGAEEHGYPDPGYLNRVREELEAKGIK